MRVTSAGDGYKYLLRTVASGDGDQMLSKPLTRYHPEKDSPPGRWLGSAVTALGGGAITVGDQVTETQLQLLVVMGRDHVTGDPLGSVYRNYPPATERASFASADSKDVLTDVPVHNIHGRGLQGVGHPGADVTGFD